MGCCIGSALCCAGQLCCGCLCRPCKAVGVKGKNYSKVGYTMFQVFWMAFVLVLFLLSDKLMKVKIISQMVGSDVNQINREDDLSVQLVARMSFILLLFHTLIFVVTLARNEVAAHFHDGCWCFKFLLVTAGFIASWWIDSSFFNSFYLPFAKFSSALFLIFQVFVIIYSSYLINERLVKNAQYDTSGCSTYILYGVLLVLLGLDILLAVRSFFLFTCTSAVTIQSVTLILIVLMFVLQIVGVARRDASILTHTLVAFYVLYLQWTSLSSSSDEACNKNYGDSGNSILQIFLGMFWTILALLFYSGSQETTGMEEIKQEATQDEGLKKKDQYEGGAKANKARLIEKDGDSSDDEHKKSTFVFSISEATIYFQAMMMMSSIYYSMLCTNWLNPTLFQHQGQTDESIYWLKTSCFVISLLIYLVSLIFYNPPPQEANQTD